MANPPKEEFDFSDVVDKGNQEFDFSDIVEPVKKKRIKRKKRTFYQRLKDSFSAFRKEWRR